MLIRDKTHIKHSGARITLRFIRTTQTIEVVFCAVQRDFEDSY